MKKKLVPSKGKDKGIVPHSRDNELNKASALYSIEMTKLMHPDVQKLEESVGDAAEIIKIKNAAKRHLAKAEKSHLEAAMYLRAGDQQRAAKSAAIAHQHQIMASEVQKESNLAKVLDSDVPGITPPNSDIKNE